MGIDASQRGRRNRRKGHDFERAVANMLCNVPGCTEARRGLQFRDGAEVPDVDGTCMWIECKVGARPNIDKAYKQAQAATDGRPVVVFSKRTGEQPMVTVSVETWLAVLEQLYGVIT